MKNNPKTLPDSWDLSGLGKKINDPLFIKERASREKKTKSFVKKWKKNLTYLSDKKVLKNALDEFEKLGKLSESEGMYLFLMRQTNSGDSKLTAAYKKYADWAQGISNELNFFRLALATIDQKLQKNILKDNLFSEYNNFLKNIFKNSKFMLSEKEEKILSLKSGLSSENWSSMVGDRFSQESRDVLTMGVGAARPKKSQNFSQIMSLLNASCSRVRKSAATALDDVLVKNSFFVEREFNSILENSKINDELRGYQRADQERILSDDLSFEIVDTMTETVTAHFKIARDFYALKAKLHGKEKLSYFERNIPLKGKTKEYSYEESFSIVDEALSLLDPEFSKIHHDMCESGRVDVYPREGKRGGAFCMYHGLKEPAYIMLNHTGVTSDVMTLAHEMGHAVHGTLAKKEKSLNYSTPMFMAEIASNFCEEYAFDKVMELASDKEKLALSMEKMGSMISSVQRQVAGYNFERNVHDVFREKGYLDSTEIGSIFQKNMKAYMGSKVSYEDGAENSWMYWHHFRSPFYVYSYASGLLIANGMRAILAENPDAWKDVKKFFYTGTSASPQEVFTEMGIDITDPYFWEQGLGQMKKLLSETKKLAKKLGKI